MLSCRRGCPICTWGLVYTLVTGGWGLYSEVPEAVCIHWTIACGLPSPWNPSRPSCELRELPSDMLPWEPEHQINGTCHRIVKQYIPVFFWSLLKAEFYFPINCEVSRNCSDLWDSGTHIWSLILSVLWGSVLCESHFTNQCTVYLWTVDPWVLVSVSCATPPRCLRVPLIWCLKKARDLSCYFWTRGSNLDCERLIAPAFNFSVPVDHMPHHTVLSRDAERLLTVQAVRFRSSLTHHWGVVVIRGHLTTGHLVGVAGGAALTWGVGLLSLQHIWAPVIHKAGRHQE